MNNYERYLVIFNHLSYLEKIKYGEYTGKYTSDGYHILNPLSYNDFERKMLCDIGFDKKWNIDK